MLDAPRALIEAGIRVSSDISHGRDAVDGAMTTTFGVSTLERFIVWTDEVGEQELNLPSRPNTRGEWRGVSEMWVA